MYHVALRKVGRRAEVAEVFRQEALGWAESLHQALGSQPPDVSWDACLFARCWLRLPSIKPGHHLLAWTKYLRDTLPELAEEQDFWADGRWSGLPVTQALAFCNGFLAELWLAEPTDTMTKSTIQATARFLLEAGNDDLPWFDHETGLFRGLVLGSGAFSSLAEINLPLHFDAINLALLAYQTGGGRKYLDVASMAGCYWSDAILRRRQLPLAIDSKGPIWKPNRSVREAYATMRSLPPENRLQQAAAFLRADAVNTFLKLWQYRGDESFRHAAEYLIDCLLPMLSAPGSWQTAATLRHYRNFTGSSRYDGVVLAEVENLFPYWIKTLSLTLRSSVNEDDSPRYPVWFENGIPRQHNPVLLSLAAEISANERLAVSALNLALAYFRLARLASASVSDYSLAPASVTTIAAGDWLNRRVGVVNEILRPALSTA
ncbi:MAG: hypothetical protein AAGF10_01660 [Verrucomicrobiota bacterium]